MHELLGKTGSVTSFWMDHIKTHCYVTVRLLPLSSLYTLVCVHTITHTIWEMLGCKKGVAFPHHSKPLPVLSSKWDVIPSYKKAGSFSDHYSILLCHLNVGISFKIRAPLYPSSLFCIHVSQSLDHLNNLIPLFWNCCDAVLIS